MSYDNNVHDSPENWGLQVIGELNDPGAGWDFDDVCFWRKGQKVYAAHDSGCSCPSPFERFESIADLTEIRSVAAAQAFIEGVENPDYLRYRTDEKRDLLHKIGRVLRGEE